MKASYIIHEKKFSEFIEEEQPDMNEKELPTWLGLLLSIGSLVVATIRAPYIMGGFFLFLVLMLIIDFIQGRKERDYDNVKIKKKNLDFDCRVQ